MIAAAVLTLVAGFLIGATTLGGLIVVPALTGLADVELDRAVAAANAAMIAPALLAMGVALGDRSQRRIVAIVAVGASLGALVGAASLAVLPATATIGTMAVLAVIGGIRGLRSESETADASRNALPVPALAALSALAGAVSAITGSGGPIAIWPLLLLASQPMALCWIAAQAIQLPVAIGATAANAFAGRLDVPMTAALAVLLAAGFVLGRRVSAKASVAWLGRVASVMLIAIAAWLCLVLVRGA
jgi:uncharacterized protein